MLADLASVLLKIESEIADTAIGNLLPITSPSSIAPREKVHGVIYDEESLRYLPIFWRLFYSVGPSPR